MSHSLRTGVAFAVIFAAACSSRPDVFGQGGHQQGQNVSSGSGFTGHVMPTVQHRQTAAAAPAAANNQLAYYGGKVISNVTIYNVYWGSAGSYQPQLDQFIQTVPPSSTYMDFLTEYNTPSQQISRGQFGGSIVDTNAPAGTTVDDTQIQAEVVNLIASGQLPPPNGNNLYMFFFPPGVNVTASGIGTSCQAFCGYHDTFVNGSNEYYYAVLPDPATCGANCDNQNGNYFADLTSVTSHELTEAVTDPEVGIAIANSAAGGAYPESPNGWVASSGSEIGDLCAWQNATVAGYNIQLEWSNAQGGCVSGPSSTSDDGGIDSGDDGGGNDAGSEGGSDGGTCGSCMTDLDCQNECPPVVGGGSNCCDPSAGICYATTQPSCPIPSDAGSE